MSPSFFGPILRETTRELKEEGAKKKKKKEMREGKQDRQAKAAAFIVVKSSTGN
jgi:hypothetical protein